MRITTLSFRNSTRSRSYPSPPAEGSDEELFELDQVRFLQSIRSQAQCDRARREDNLRVEVFFGDPAFGLLTPEEARAIHPIFKKIFRDVDHKVNSVKETYRRRRPFLHDAALMTCAQKPNDPSYPSGHASITSAFGHILMELCPSLGKQAVLNGVPPDAGGEG